MMMYDRRATHRQFAVLDIGTSKISAATVIAERGEAGLALRIAGLGVQRARGIKAGVITDLDEAETAVRAAVASAERAAGLAVDGVCVSVSCGRLRSHHFTARADVDNGVVSEDDLKRLMAGGRAFAERDGRMLVHMNRLALQLDGGASLDDPRGLSARSLSADLHAVTADDAPVRNLLVLVERCLLRCDGLIAAPYASALAVTTPEERSLGVTCIDFGAGTTSVALFADGRLIGADVVPVGSQHISFDIAKALQTPLAEAERIKTLYGTLTSAQSDDHDVFSYPLVGEDDAAAYQMTKAQLTAIIRPRVAQILSLISERLAQNRAAAFAGDAIVLTGGASQLLGIAEFTANQLGRPVRLGRPLPASGLNASAAGPQLATLAGLAMASAHTDENFAAASFGPAAAHGYLGRVGSWLKAGF